MQIAIVHYHLNRGGVTQVIINHLRALALTGQGAEALRVVIYYGGRKEAWPEQISTQLPGVEVELCRVPGVDYDMQGPARPAELARELKEAFRRTAVAARDTVVHVHNHALGKNVSLPGAVAELARDGFALLLQIHDFAEDFRPANYRALVDVLSAKDPARLAAALYWQGAAIHYAVLNGRDLGILRAAGVSAGRLHALPNPVSDAGRLPARHDARKRLKEKFGVGENQRYVIYPVRGIRRKNLGELLLWAAAADTATRFAITLPPINPLERPRYDAWRQLARQLRLPLLFEVGGPNALEFGENLAAADRAITTSVAEGFGMVFLETWLAGLSLIGRNLPEITGDFVAQGLQFDALMASLNIPLDWIGRESFEQDLAESYHEVLDAYGRPFPNRADFSRMASSLCVDGVLDFARCSARLQGLIVSLVASDSSRRKRLLEMNPAMAAGLAPVGDHAADLIQHNGDAVRENYSLESSGRRLREIYQYVLDSPRQEPSALERGSNILDGFLSLTRFNPVRIE